MRGGRRWWWRGALAAETLLVLALLLDLAFPVPLPDGRGAGAIVFARDGTPLRAFADRDSVWRYPTSPERVSPLYVQALVGYEDRWFFEHPGINPFALARAGWQWLAHGRRLLWFNRFLAALLVATALWMATV